MTTDARLKRLIAACRAVNPQAELILTVTTQEVRLQLKGMREQPVHGAGIDEALAAGEGAIRSAVEQQQAAVDAEMEAVRQRHEAIHSLLSPNAGAMMVDGPVIVDLPLPGPAVTIEEAVQRQLRGYVGMKADPRTVLQLRAELTDLLVRLTGGGRFYPEPVVHVLVEDVDERGAMRVEVTQPHFEHDCRECEFLGRWEGLDLYSCEKSGTRMRTYIARFGDAGPDYESSPWATTRATQEAQRRWRLAHLR